MTHYCETTDVASRLGLNAAQRTAAETRLENGIRRASIDIDIEFKSYGRATPSTDIANSTLNGAITAGATTITLADASSFSTSGNGDIDGDSFAWTGKSSNDLTGCTGITFDHQNNAKVHEGEFAHVLKEVCADLGAAYYLEDEAIFLDATTYEKGGMRSNVLRQRGLDNLRRIAHLGSVD